MVSFVDKLSEVTPLVGGYSLNLIETPETPVKTLFLNAGVRPVKIPQTKVLAYAQPVDKEFAGKLVPTRQYVRLAAVSPQLLAAALSLAESSEPGSVADKESQIVQHAPKTLSSDPHLPQPNEPCTEQEQALFDQWGVQEPTLTRAQKLAVVRVLEKNKEVFAKDSWDLGECKLAKHHIDTGSAAPIHCNPHRLAFALRETLREELNEMLRGGIIEPSESAWAAPVTYVPKADGSWRLLRRL